MELFSKDCPYPIQKLLQEMKECDNLTFLGRLFGENGEYKVIYLDDPYIKTTMLQRFNLFWVWPLFLIAAPFSYILRGKIGVDKYTRFGKLLTKIVGEY